MSADLYIFGLGEITPETIEAFSNVPEPSYTLSQKIKFIACQTIRFIRHCFGDRSALAAYTIHKGYYQLRQSKFMGPLLGEGRVNILRGLQMAATSPSIHNIEMLHTALRVTEWMHNDANNQHLECGSIYRDLLPLNRRSEEEAARIAKAYFRHLTGEDVELGAITRPQVDLIQRKLEILDLIGLSAEALANKELFSFSAALGKSYLPDLSDIFMSEFDTMIHPLFE